MKPISISMLRWCRICRWVMDTIQWVFHMIVHIFTMRWGTQMTFRMAMQKDLTVALRKVLRKDWCMVLRKVTNRVIRWDCVQLLARRRRLLAIMKTLIWIRVILKRLIMIWIHMELFHIILTLIMNMHYWDITYQHLLIIMLKTITH